MTGVEKVHLLWVRFDEGFQIGVQCPREDGSQTRDESTFQQYAEDCDPEEWLHGVIEFEPIPLGVGDVGENWHAVAT